MAFLKVVGATVNPPFATGYFGCDGAISLPALAQADTTPAPEGRARSQ